MEWNFLINFYLFFVTLFVILNPCKSEEKKGCKFETHREADDVLMNAFKPLLYRRYSAKDSIGQFSYNIGICINAVDKTVGEGTVKEYTGVFQRNIKDKNHGGTVVGRYDQAALIKGNQWVILEYMSGDPYHSHCGNEARRARIMITCDNTVTVGEEEILVLEEQRNKTGECYYLFEMATSAVCTDKPLITVGLSVGSVIVIIFVCVLTLYLVLGFAYNRFVLGAKGMEQFPNYSFWQDFGNLQADGCNLVCRSGSRGEKQTYRGLGDDQLQEEEERDDHLLPM